MIPGWTQFYADQARRTDNSTRADIERCTAILGELDTLAAIPPLPDGFSLALLAALALVRFDFHDDAGVALAEWRGQREQVAA